MFLKKQSKIFLFFLFLNNFKKIKNIILIQFLKIKKTTAN